MCLDVLIYTSLQQKVNLLNSKEIKDTSFKSPQSQMKKTKNALFVTQKTSSSSKTLFCIESKGRGIAGLELVINEEQHADS